MRTRTVKHGLGVAIVALVAACGSNERAANSPSTTTYGAQTSTTQTSIPESPAPQTPAFGQPGVQRPTATVEGSEPPFPNEGTTTNDTSQAKIEKSLTDGEIVGIATAANTGEIDEAEYAIKHATNKDVKAFAATMIKQHTDANEKGKALAKKDNITPQDSDVSAHLKSEVTSTMADLRNRTGADFDRGYIDSQVTAHKEVLSLLDDRLIPSAENADLESALKDVRKMVDMHLTKAEDLQSKLGATSSTTTTPSNDATSKAKTNAETKPAKITTPKMKSSATPKY